MPLSPFDRRKRMRWPVGLIAAVTLFVSALGYLLIKMDPVTIDGDDGLFMPSIGMLGHLL